MPHGHTDLRLQECTLGCCVQLTLQLFRASDLMSLAGCRLRRFKALVDAAVFLDVPQYVPPVPQIMPHRAAAQAMQSQFGAQWDPACAAAQPVLPPPPCCVTMHGSGCPL